MKTEPEKSKLENIVVEPIENGYLVRISTYSEDRVVACRSYRQVIQFLKTIKPEEL